MALTDMKRTKADRKAQKEKYDTVSPGGGDDYPYGLSMHLGHEELTKLGLDKLPRVGDKLHLRAHAHVTSVSENHRDGGKSERRIELQLRKMEVAAEKKASEGEIHEGKLTGAMAAMDKALDKKEGKD